MTMTADDRRALEEALEEGGFTGGGEEIGTHETVIFVEHVPAIIEALGFVRPAPPSEVMADRLRRIVDSIHLGMRCEVRIGRGEEERGGALFVQIQCWRLDVITKEYGWGYGGKAWPSEHATDSEIIQMIFGLYKSYWEHEARETFELRDEAGEYRRPFGPHIDTWALWSVARRVDVRSARHVEDCDAAPAPDVDEDGDAVSSGAHRRVTHQGSEVCDTCVNFLGINVRWDHAVLRPEHIDAS